MNQNAHLAMPDLFVAGAPKAGTSAIVAGLGQHPDIFVPDVKEVRYFDRHVYYDYEEDYRVKDLDEYLDYYRGQQAQLAQYRVDGSVFCMYSRHSIESILDLSPSAKFLVMLRDPAQAARSMHGQRLKHSRPEMREVSSDFCKCWELMKERRNGEGFPANCRNRFLFRYDLLYSYQHWLPTMIDLVPKGNLLIQYYEDFLNTPGEVFEQILQFLGSSCNFLPESRIVNPSYNVQPTWLASTLERLAKSTYRFRKAVGLRGERVARIKSLQYNRISEINRQPLPCDNRIRDFFSDANSYISRLKVNYPGGRI